MKKRQKRRRRDEEDKVKRDEQEKGLKRGMREEGDSMLVCVWAMRTKEDTKGGVTFILRFYTQVRVDYG